MTSTVRGDRAWLWFGAWLLVGAGWCLALLGILSIGLLVAPVMALLTVWLATRRGSAVGLPGLVSGAAPLLLVVGWLNRGGPGDVCTSTPGGDSCTQEWDPTGWLAAGSVLLVAGVVLFLLLRRARTRRNPAGDPAGFRFTA